jgi:hypothetical protein
MSHSWTLTFSFFRQRHTCFTVSASNGNILNLKLHSEKNSETEIKKKKIAANKNGVRILRKLL